MNKELVVKALNNLIEQAVCDGGDPGGAYHQNEDELVKAMNEILAILDLDKEYSISMQDTTHWSKYFIERG